jgi:hypothetical protein
MSKKMPKKPTRTWREKEVNPIDPVDDYESYQSFQKVINSNNGQVDEDLLEEHINEMMADPRFTWEEIPVDFGIIKPGDRIRYTTTNAKGEYLFRTGGWVIAIDENKEWLVYHAHTHTNWTLQSEDCQRLFVIRSRGNKKGKSDYIKFKVPGEETDYNSYLTKNGVKYRVGSFRDKWTQDRFEGSSKFKDALSGKKWEFKQE